MLEVVAEDHDGIKGERAAAQGAHDGTGLNERVDLK
jgi:hypothetical protein